MTASPRVSVLLPYRDAGGTIEDALGSLLLERAIDFEVIAIDDGSRDDGAVRVARISRGDARVVSVATEGVGIVGALGRGMEAARGELVARMDGDDISVPGRLAASAALLDANPEVGVVGTLVHAFPEGAFGEGTRRYVDWMNGLVSPADHDRDLFVESPLCHPSVTMRRDALAAVGGYRDEPWPEDYDLWVRLHAAGWKLAKVAGTWLRWRQHARRLTVTDARYTRPRFDALKGRYLSRRVIAAGRPLAVWGAGKTGKRIARALRQNGVAPALFVDIDPRKIGSVAQDAPIVAFADLPRDRYTIVVAVGAPGARAIVRGRLSAAGFVEGVDYLCAS